MPLLGLRKPMPTDPNLASWLAGGAIVGAFAILWWVAKRWISMQEDQFDDLNARVDRMDDKKLDVEAFNGWTQRVDGQFERILAEQQRSFAESREERQKQGEKIDEMLASTQSFNLTKAGKSDRVKAKRKSFKARHGKNIAKGKMSAAYWASKVKW